MANDNVLLQAQNFWASDGNYKQAMELEKIPRRPYVYCHLTPVSALSKEGDTIELRPAAGRTTVTCELAFIVGKETRGVDAEEALKSIGSYHILVGFKSWGWLDRTPPPVHNPLQVDRNHWHWRAKYSRWPDGYNCLSAAGVTPRELPDPYGSEIHLAVDGVGAVKTSTADYLHHAPSILAHMCRTITLVPGTVFSLGPVGPAIELPSDRRLPEGTRVHARIGGIGSMSTPILDRRELD